AHPLLSHRDGREVRADDLGPPEARDRRDPEEEQLGPELRGALPQRLHHGPSQTWRQALPGTQRRRHGTSPLN
ncbi:hypothetical protein AAVH_41290, partial [Aphelenchoides avenae]